MDARTLAADCSDPGEIAEVLGLTYGSAMAFSTFNCVYVIAPEGMPVAKVGVACDPNSRLSGLQCGNWNKLFVRSLFWCAKDAYELEGDVLKKLKGFGVNLVGEWGAIEPDDMALLVAKCAKERGSYIATSRMFLDSWVAFSAHRWASIKAEARAA